MQKIIFQNSKGLNLVGVLHFPKQKTTNAIIISHGFMGNKDRPRFIKLSKVLSENGFAVLRFDFGGCGESEDREITVKNQVDDLKSAINYLRKNDYQNISLLGESLGGLTSVLAYDKKIKTIVLLSPVTKAKTPSIFESEEYLKELEKKDFIIYYKERDNREFKIPKEYLIERQSVNQKEILSKIKCSVLIIHGDKDDTIPLEHSKEAMKYLSKNSKLEIIKDGGHVILDEKIDEVISISVNWFKKFLAPLC